MKKKLILLSVAAIPFLIGCGGGGSATNSSVAKTAKITGTVPGTKIEAFCDNGKYYTTTSHNNGTNKHPFELNIEKGSICTLVMTMNETNATTRTISTLAFKDSLGNPTTHIVITKDAIDLGYIDLPKDPLEMDDSNDDHVKDTPIVLNHTTETKEENTSLMYDNNNNGMVDIYEDSNDDGIPNAYEDNNHNGTPDIHDDDNHNGTPDMLETDISKSPDNDTGNGNTEHDEDTEHNDHTNHDENTTGNTNGGDTTSPSSGAITYRTNCVRCHGAAENSNVKNVSLSKLKTVLQNGKGSMPPFPNINANDIYTYFQTLNGDNTTGGGTTDGNTGNTSNSSYILTAWNDLGMHCMDGNDFSVWSVLPPFNNLHAQLKDKNGGLVTSGVILTYEATTGTDGQRNTSSADKTNFWDYSNALFPHSNLQPDTGLLGNKTPSDTPQNMHYDTQEKWWKAEGLPLTPYNDDGSKNYYPLVKVVAKDTSGNILATAKVVLPVSDEMDCKRCHASNSLSPKAKPNAGWVNNTDPEKDFKLNVLRLHDERVPNAVKDYITELTAKGYTYDIAGLEATANTGTPILCAACHSSNALPGTGVSGVPAFTQAIHSYHATVIDPYTNLPMNDSQNRDSCYACHPGSSTKCLRGAMGDAKDTNGQNTMQCQSCHGSISHVGDKNRKGWFDEPNCQACHHDGMRETSAIDPATNTLRHVVDTQFATNMNTPMTGISLYRFSTGHGKLQCEACHGATHAIYPAHNADNLLSEGVQGHTGTIAECTACHTTAPRTINKGPHGMHTVGQTWIQDHRDAAEKNSADCKACHGQNYRGSVLSKTWSDRTFDVEGKNKIFTKGHQISCYDCHNGPNP